ncbi:MAG: alpha/beta fold hydrolase [Ktedonobacterales bacterium]|nr:alpha/beta fold hydrolase [Ktedonobacterales bacterium]
MADVLQQRWIDVDGMRLYTRSAEAAAPRGALPVVCVHAFGTSSRTMLPLMRLLAPSHPVYALDLPGHGYSRHEPFRLNFADAAATIDAWMDALAIPQALIIGHSSGCQTVVHVGIRSPERLHSAVLLAPSIDERTRSFPRQALRLLRAGLRESPAVPWVLLRDYMDVGLPHIIQTIQFDLESEFVGLLPLFKQPVAVVCGSLDTLALSSWGQRVAQLLPKGRFVEIPYASHVAQYSAPRRLLVALAPFLAEAVQPMASTP